MTSPSTGAGGSGRSSKLESLLIGGTTSAYSGAAISGSGSISGTWIGCSSSAGGVTAGWAEAAGVKAGSGRRQRVA